MGLGFGVPTMLTFGRRNKGALRLGPFIAPKCRGKQVTQKVGKSSTLIPTPYINPESLDPEPHIIPLHNQVEDPRP